MLFRSSLGIDLNVRHRGARVSGSLGFFTHQFRGYIYQQEIASHLIPRANNPEELRVMQYVAKDAEFNGAEVELTFHLVREAKRTLDLDLGADTVRATNKSTRENLPRIPARQYSAKLAYGHQDVLVALEVHHKAAQTRAAHDESTTPRHTLLNASATWRLRDGRRTWEVFLRGTNLTNAVAREHASFLKEFAPLPGRGLGGGARLHF